MNYLKRALFWLNEQLPWFKRLLPKYAKDVLFRRLYNNPPIRTHYKQDEYPAGVNLYGYLSASLGLGQGARLYSQALNRIALPTVQVDTSFLLCKNRGGGHIPVKAAPYAISLVHLNPDLLPHLYQAMDSTVWNGRYQVGVWLWELERLPDAWLPWLSIFDEFWAPSHFIEDTLRRDTQLPVHYMPYGIEAPIEMGVGRSAFDLPEDAFLVLCMFDMHSHLSRKNPEAAVRAFQAAFPSEENAVLVLKTHSATAAELEHLCKLTGQANNVRVFHADMEKPRLNALIACCDALLSLHRSEGFGLVLAEAMLLRVPVVATGWSANTDFMDSKCACMVEYELIPADGDYMSVGQGQQWAEPSVADAARWLRKLYLDPAFHQEIAAAGQRRIQQDYSIDACAARMLDRLSNIIKAGRET